MVDPFEYAPVGIHQQVALTPLDLFARIVSNGGTLLGGFDALRVNDASRGPRMTTLLASRLASVLGPTSSQALVYFTRLLAPFALFQ